MTRSLFGLTLLCLILPAGAFSAPVVLDRLDASVNAAIILKSDVDRFRKTERLRSQLDPLYSGTALAAKGKGASDTEITGFLIDEKLIEQLFPVADSEVEQEINSIQANNKIDRNSLKSALAQQGFSFEDYFQLIRSSASKRNLIDREIRTKVNITDSDIKNYYFNKFSQTAPENRTYKLRIIYISPKTYKTQAAAKDAAQNALKAVRGGESFEEVAKRTSDDASASSGGDLGTLTEDQMAPAIRDQLKKMQIGQVSEVFGNPGAGYYIVKLEDVGAEEGGRLEKMKDEIKSQLLASEYQHQIGLWLERQRQNAFIHRAGESSVGELPPAAEK